MQNPNAESYRRMAAANPPVVGRSLRRPMYRAANGKGDGQRNEGTRWRKICMTLPYLRAMAVAPPAIRR